MAKGNKLPKSAIRMALAIFLIIVISLLGLFAYKYNQDHNNKKDTTVSKTTTVGKVHPLLDQYPHAPQVSSGNAINISSSTNSATSTSGHSININGSMLTAAGQQCTTINPQDFCIVATGKTPNASFDLYYLKDAVHSRLFENVTDFQTKNVNGSPSAGTMTLQLTNTVKSPIIVAANSDSSGWMIIMKNNNTTNIDSIISNMTVK